MYEFLFNIAEWTTSPRSVLFTLALGLFVSLLTTLIIRKKINRKSLIEPFVGGGVMFVICTLIYFGVRNGVQSERLSRIQTVLLSIDPNNFTCNYSDTPITNWRVGLDHIRRCPDEVGYYLATCDILEQEKDYESALLLVELGLDAFEDIPTLLCERLVSYYSILPEGRPRLGEGCLKIHN